MGVPVPVEAVKSILEEQREWEKKRQRRSQIFMSTRLVDLLSSLPTRPARQQVELWRVQKGQRTRTTRLLHSLGNRITAAQAKRLDTLGLPHTVLCELRAASAGDEEFQKALRECGVHSKPLREKLAAVVPKMGDS